MLKFENPIINSTRTKSVTTIRGECWGTRQDPEIRDDDTDPSRGITTGLSESTLPSSFSSIRHPPLVVTVKCYVFSYNTLASCLTLIDVFTQFHKP
jgi:hypothetical protein